MKFKIGMLLFKQFVEIVNSIRQVFIMRAKCCYHLVALTFNTSQSTNKNIVPI